MRKGLIFLFLVQTLFYNIASAQDEAASQTKNNDLLVINAGSPLDNSEETIEPGKAGGACLSNGSCNEGLVCENNTCLPVWTEHPYIDDFDGALITEVFDSFDDDDPFDLTIRVGYTYSTESVKITQQCAPGDHSGCLPERNDIVTYKNLFEYNQVKHNLQIDAIIGLYKDLAFFTSWPIVLLDSRSLDWWDDDSSAYMPQDRDGNDLFSIPFDSPDRSGIDWFSVGLMWTPFNQMRDETKPTWLLQFESRFAIGDALKASCKDENGSVTGDCSTSGGISRRVTDLIFRTILSRRFQYVDPYIGFEFMTSIPDRNSDFPSATTSVEGQINTMPGFVGTMMFGFEFIPFEKPADYLKTVIGLHFFASWHGEGRDYSPLFDALGTNRNLDREYGYADNQLDDVGEIYTGLTDNESYGIFGGKLTLHVQAAKYVRLSLILGYTHEQEHFITFADPCNPSVSSDSDQCISYDSQEHQNVYGDAFNPDWREEIDDVGHRFRAEKTDIFDVNILATILF